MSTQNATWRELKHLGTKWRAHPVPYQSKAYPWRVPPMACASCGLKSTSPYRLLRTQAGQVLLLHLDCNQGLLERLNPLPLGEA